MPLDTILLLDTSGSMAGRGITELKRACKTFLDGVEETAQQTGLKENVSIVEFNSSARIVQSLSTDYSRCRRAVESLKAGGRTAMLDGLLEALKEILQNGGIVRVCGLAMTPRIILMTDGEPSDDAGEVEGKKKVLAAALGFGPGWRELGLPHPVPIACVGCGACDSELLEAIAKITNGMHVIVGNVAELSTFFKRQVLLIRFAMQFAADMERLQSQLALAAFLQELGEAVEEAELEAMMTLLLAMVVTSGDDPPQSIAQPGRRAIAAPSATSQAGSSLPLRPTGQLAIRASVGSSTPQASSTPPRGQLAIRASTTSSASNPRTTSPAQTASSATRSSTSPSLSASTGTTTSVQRSSANTSSTTTGSSTAASSTAVVRPTNTTTSLQRRQSSDRERSCILQ